MPHSRFHWAGRIKETEREYRSIRIALDWLLTAAPEDIHEVVETRGWDDLAVADSYAADRNLDATYLIRMYSVFERTVSSYWRILPGNAGRDLRGDDLLQEIGAARRILTDVIRDAQTVRAHRNKIVHGRIDDHADLMEFETARGHLMTFLRSLPETWG